jgi:hypothetical protein
MLLGKKEKWIQNRLLSNYHSEYTSNIFTFLGRHSHANKKSASEDTLARMQHTDIIKRIEACALLQSFYIQI